LIQLKQIVDEYSPKLNLNSFNFDSNGNTLLHSAIISKQITMVEYIWNQLTPYSKTFFLKFKSLDHQTPFTLAKKLKIKPIEQFLQEQIFWNPSSHYTFTSFIKKQIITIMILTLKSPISNKPYFPEILFYQLPKDILYSIFKYLAN